MNGYKFFYNGKDKDFYAETLLAAKDQAVAHFKPPKSQRHMVHGGLCETDVDPATGKGKQVVHKADM